jgi:hypothetical protein
MKPFKHILNAVLAPIALASIDDKKASMRKRAFATWILARSDTRDATARLQRLVKTNIAPSTVRVIAICGLSRRTHFSRAGSEQVLRHAAAYDPRQHCRITALFRLAAHGINPRDIEHVRAEDRLQAIAQLTT